MSQKKVFLPGGLFFLLNWLIWLDRLIELIELIKLIGLIRLNWFDWNIRVIRRLNW